MSIAEMRTFVTDNEHSYMTARDDVVCVNYSKSDRDNIFVYFNLSLVKSLYPRYTTNVLLQMLKEDLQNHKPLDKHFNVELLGDMSSQGHHMVYLYKLISKDRLEDSELIAMSVAYSIDWLLVEKLIQKKRVTL